VLRLVRPWSCHFALGLGLVFSELYIPLVTWCLRAPLLHTRACNIARSHQPYLWCDHLACIRGNEACDVWVGSLTVKTTRSGPGEGISGNHYRVEKARGLSTELPGQELSSCEGSNKDEGEVWASRYLSKIVIARVCISLTHHLHFGTYMFS
jgi:hypothetical protein